MTEVYTPFWPVYVRFLFFFHIVTSLQALLLGFDFNAEGFTLVPGYKNHSHPAQRHIFPSAPPQTQEIQLQGTKKG